MATVRFPVSRELTRGRWTALAGAVGCALGCAGFAWGIAAGAMDERPVKAWIYTVLLGGGSIGFAVSARDRWRLHALAAACADGANAVVVPAVEVPEKPDGTLKYEATGPDGRAEEREVDLVAKHGPPLFADQAKTKLVVLQAVADRSVAVVLQETGYPFEIPREARAALVAGVSGRVPEELRAPAPATAFAPRPRFTAEFRATRWHWTLVLAIGLIGLLTGAASAAMVFSRDESWLALGAVSVVALFFATLFLRWQLDRVVADEKGLRLVRPWGAEKSALWSELRAVEVESVKFGFLALAAGLTWDRGRALPPPADGETEDDVSRRLRALGMGDLGARCSVKVLVPKGDGETARFQLGAHFGWDAAHRIATEARAARIDVRIG